MFGAVGGLCETGLTGYRIKIKKHIFDLPPRQYSPLFDLKPSQY